MQGRVPSTSALFVERAYVDWRFTDSDATFPSVLTIGRQPSSDGPSHQFKANTARKATYSALVFDGASDGVVLTSSLKNITSLKNANLKFAYGKGFQNDENKGFVTNAFIGSDNSLKDTDVYGLFFESSILNKSNTLFQIGVAQMDNIVANSLETNTSANKNVGDVTFAGVMFEGTNINIVDGMHLPILLTLMLNQIVIFITSMVKSYLCLIMELILVQKMLQLCGLEQDTHLIINQK
jgi:hypothetical protein